jgi:hypothetical protein
MNRNFKIANGVTAGQVAYRVSGQEKNHLRFASSLAHLRSAFCWSAERRFSKR